ncbi:VOC family protein [Winogradskya consettensis]|uniref:Glyoxalase n=1 Tax=Winogradskya consettensis TaxID=113560 RepID=A0A919SBI6_9ACTN|nr:VOC family protein [Actinoplanes consettensis]GIM69570.1 glyoxalase [Actinoplanes consettensis]
MLRGLTTITYFADDVAAAATWYAEVLGVQPYFDRLPAYTEFRIGDYQHELGILNRRYAPHDTTGPGGVITYWAVDDLNAAYARLLQLGATEHEKPTERGPGFVTASVLDPFGNILGIMANQHYLDILAR